MEKSNESYQLLFTMCSLLKKGYFSLLWITANKVGFLPAPGSRYFFLLVSSTCSSCSASLLGIYFSKHLFAIARALLNSVLSLLAFFKVGKNSRTALDLKDCWFSDKFLSFRIPMFFFRRICFKFVFYTLSCKFFFLIETVFIVFKSERICHGKNEREQEVSAECKWVPLTTNQCLLIRSSRSQAEKRAKSQSLETFTKYKQF